MVSTPVALPSFQAIIRPVLKDGGVIRDDDQIETFTFGTARLIPSGTRAQIRIELAQHVDGTWMWATSRSTGSGGGGYRVGPKWGQFAPTRDDAIIAACHEVLEKARPLPDGAAEWLEQLAGTQPDLFGGVA